MTRTTPNPEPKPAWWESLTPGVEEIQRSLGRARRLDALLVLGSGLGDAVSRWTARKSWGPGALPGSGRPTVAGHSGSFHWMTVGESKGGRTREVLVQQGRVHLYEGGGLDGCLFATRLAFRLGAPWLLLTNAAGAIDSALRPGMLLILHDLVSLAMGRGLSQGGRLGRPANGFAAGSPFDRGWVRRLTDLAAELGIPARSGILGGSTGPAYETAAEVEAWRRIGAHAGTMSTVIEALEGRALGMKVGGISFLSNMATGLGGGHVDHEDVIALAKTASVTLGALLERALAEGPAG